MKKQFPDRKVDFLKELSSFASYLKMKFRIKIFDQQFTTLQFMNI